MNRRHSSPVLAPATAYPALLPLALCAALLGVLPLANAQTPAANTVPAAAAVSVARLETVWMQPEREAPAQMLSRNVSRLSAETSGTLLRWTVDVGASVQRGQVLAQIDQRDAELALQRAQAALDASQARLQLAQVQLQRSKQLVAQGFFSAEALAQRETEVALIQTEVSANRAQWALAQRQQEKTTLRAPFAGHVTERLAQVGEAVAPGTVLYVLSESGPADVSATLNPADVPGLRTGSQLRFETQGQSYPVQVQRVLPTLSTPARTQVVRLSLRQPNDAPPAGSSGTLRWQSSSRHVPPSLLVRRHDQLGLFVQQASAGQTLARFVPLPGAQEGRASAVSLPGDTWVVVRGQASLQDGQAIKATPAGPANGSTPQTPGQ